MKVIVRIAIIVLLALLTYLVQVAGGQEIPAAEEEEAIQQPLSEAYKFSVALPMVVTSTLEWQEYQDLDYEFTVEYPTSGWQVETRWHVPEAGPQTITKRVSFLGKGSEIIVDIWKQPQEDIVAWVEYLNHRMQPDFKADINGLISGFPSVVFIEENEEAPNVLTTAFSDARHTYLIQYLISDGGQAMNTYLHLLESYRPTLDRNAEVIEEFYFPLEVEEKAIQNAMSFRVDTCCGVTDPGNPFPCVDGNCVWWVYYKKGYVPMTGDAWRWGYKVNSGLYPGWYLVATPSLPGIAWWDRNSCWSSSGHVANMEGKSGSNTWIRVSEMTYEGTACSEEPRTRTFNIPSCQAPSGYIRQ